MFLRTIQASAFKSIFEVLKDVLHDINVVFDETGMRILTLDTAKVTLINLHLLADNFEEYKCDPNQVKVVAGINMVNMFKLLKIVGNNDILSMSITTTDKVKITVENSEKNSTTHFTLNLLDINEDFFESPEIPGDVVETVMSSADFQRICRDMGNLAKKVSICRHSTKLTISCQGDFASQSTDIEFPQEVPDTMDGTYSLKYLNLFTKATGLSSNVVMRQTASANFLVLNYAVASLGYLDFYLASEATEPEEE
jgi:proliferating cell nuclear antigen